MLPQEPRGCQGWPGAEGAGRSSVAPGARGLLVLLGTLTPLPGCRTQDMNREVVKTDCATARIPELDFEIPAFTQKGGGCMAAGRGGLGWAGLGGQGWAQAGSRGGSVTVLSLLLSPQF